MDLYEYMHAAENITLQLDIKTLAIANSYLPDIHAIINCQQWPPS